MIDNFTPVPPGFRCAHEFGEGKATRIDPVVGWTLTAEGPVPVVAPDRGGVRVPSRPWAVVPRNGA